MAVAYPNVADRLFGRAHAIEPNALRAIVEGPLGQRVLAGERLEVHAKRKDRERVRRAPVLAMVPAETVRSNDGLTEYAITSDGVVVISIAGALSKRFDWLAAACGFTTYEGLSASIEAALSDYRARALLFRAESPGGAADGMLECSNQILKARDKMPVWAVADSYAASAAYALVGSAEKLYLPVLGQLGSIGAFMIHVDQSAADQARGLKYTGVSSSPRKLDGWEHAPLSPEAKASAQARVDHIRDVFAELVGRQGRMSAKAAIATDGQVYSDQAAVDAKLADGIKTFDEALKALTAEISKSSFTPNPGASAMTNEDQLLTGASGGAIAAAANHPAAATAETKPAAEAAVDTKPAAAIADVPAAAAAAAPAVAAAAAASKPKPGEACATCGQVMPDDDDDGMPNDPDATAAGNYTMATMTKTLELCAIARVPASTAQAFVTAKAPLAKVRAELAAQSAKAADAVAIDGTGKPAGDTEASVAAAWNEVVAKINEGLPQARPQRR
jgi:ClpP class serine protease